MEQNPTIDAFIDVARAQLPPLFTRAKAAEVAGLNRRTLANLEALRTGPAKIIQGGRAMYERESFLRWLRERSLTAQEFTARRGRPPKQGKVNAELADSTVPKVKSKPKVKAKRKPGSATAVTK